MFSRTSAIPGFDIRPVAGTLYPNPPLYQGRVVKVGTLTYVPYIIARCQLRFKFRRVHPAHPPRLIGSVSSVLVPTYMECGKWSNI